MKSMSFNTFIVNRKDGHMKRAIRRTAVVAGLTAGLMTGPFAAAAIAAPTLNNGSVKVDTAAADAVELILNGASITNSS